jgi:hypothetical protein
LGGGGKHETRVAWGKGVSQEGLYESVSSTKLFKSGDPVVNVLDQQLVLENSAIYKNHPLRPQTKCSQSRGVAFSDGYKSTMDWCSVYLTPQALSKYIYLSPPLIFPTTLTELGQKTARCEPLPLIFKL